MNIFLFNKSLRLFDNTTLISQSLSEINIVPIFIFTDQISKSKNKYYSPNSGNFLLETIDDLGTYIEKYKGKLYCFQSDNILDVFNDINNINTIRSIGYNIDYSPYALKRQNILQRYCEKNNIKLYAHEDLLIYNMLNGETLKTDGYPYKVFTPFKNSCQNNLKPTLVNIFNDFNFTKNNKLEKSKYYLRNINKLCNQDNKIIIGKRLCGLDIIKNSILFKDYDTSRNEMNKETTYLSAYLNFGLLSIREVYDCFKDNKAIINQLIWRQFNTNLIYYFPYILQNQITNKPNSAFNIKFNNIQWDNDMNLFELWKNGNTGFPIVDAGMRQLNSTGYMHNRSRMICADFLTKLLLIDWRHGEKYFAHNLTDYNSIQNICGWLWIIGGIDPKQLLRLFNPFLQSAKYDSDCTYIKKYVVELKNIDNKLIHNYNKLTNLDINNYNKPIIDYVNNRKRYFDAIRKL